MEAEPQTFHVSSASPAHSRTLTPTAAVRPRPRLPLTLSTRSRSIEHPPGSDVTVTSDAGGVDDLAGALSELGRTDFVRKYSRRSRPPRSNVEPTTSPTSDMDIRSAASSPVVTSPLRHQQVRSPDVIATKRRTDDCSAAATASTNCHNIPAATEQRLADQSPLGVGDSAGGDVVQETSPLEERSKRAASGWRSSRAGAGLSRSESDSSKMRSFTLRSLQPRATGNQSSHIVSHVPPPAPRRGATAPLLVGDLDTPTTMNSTEATVDTDDEGVGAVDIDEPCFKDTYMSVTTAGSRGAASSNRGALCRDKHLLPHFDVLGLARGRHQRFAEHDSALGETSNATPASAGVSTSTQKTNSGGRFQTHPPLRERTLTCEPGSVDSNGLGALRDVSDPNKHMLCLASQVSVSSADSHICPSEGSTSLSFGGEGSVETAVAADRFMSSPDQLVRKNSKTQKHKSKSDPTRGEKNGDSSVVDIPSIVSGTMHAQSSPVLLEENDKSQRNERQSTTQFPFTTDSASASSDLSERGTAAENNAHSANHVVVAGNTSAKFSPMASVEDVAVRVVLKSDDSFEDLPPTTIKPPRPKTTKKRPRAPPSPLTTPMTVNTTETSLSPASSLVRKVFSKDRSSPSSKLQTKETGGSETELSTAASTSSLTIPFSKKSSLLRSHSSAGSEVASGTAGGSAAAERSKHSEHPQSLAISRQRSPGALDAGNVNVPRIGTVTASASVPELCDTSNGRLLHARDHNSLSTSYAPSLEPVLSSSTISLFDGSAAGDKVGLFRTFVLGRCSRLFWTEFF